MENKYCSPLRNSNDFTCFDHIDLIEIAKAYNKYALKHKLHQINIFTKDKFELWKSIKKRLKHRYEYKWLDEKFIDNISNKKILKKIKKYTFKPKSPRTIKTWFNTTHIEEVLYQYEKMYNNFKFLGAEPADIVRIKKFNFKKLKSKYEYLGIVFNTDTHNKPGQHWLAVFIDNNSKTIEYFDSLGESPNKYIREFLNKFKDYSLIINTKVHQKGGINCGAYSVFFIIQKLKGMSMDEINNYNITDNMMNKYRKIIFRPY